MAGSTIRGRDAVHAATALQSGFDLIASTDPDFDEVPGLRWPRRATLDSTPGRPMTRRAECVRCEVEAQWGFTRPAVERVPARPSTKFKEKCRTHLTQSRAWLAYSTATSLDGFIIIDDHDSLTWLFATPDHSGDPTAATATPTPFSSTRSCRQSARWCWAPTAMSGSAPSSRRQVGCSNGPTSSRPGWSPTANSTCRRACVGTAVQSPTCTPTWSLPRAIAMCGFWAAVTWPASLPTRDCSTRCCCRCAPSPWAGVVRCCRAGFGCSAQR